MEHPFDATSLHRTSLSPGTYMTGVNPDDMQRIEPLAIDVPCKSGDLLLFSNVVVHRGKLTTLDAPCVSLRAPALKGGVNSTDAARWSADWRFQDASKPTFREEQGHIVWSEAGGGLQSSSQWAEASLS
jgi:hypothetical protein